MMDRRERFDIFILGIILIEIFIIILIILNYGNCFQDYECIATFTPTVIKDGRNFSWHDIINSFNAWGLDGDSRSRFLSYFFYIIVIKTRLFLWNFMPPHPTLSITWLFTLFLAPVLLFRFLRIILEEKTAVWAGMAIYLSSCGYLFNTTMLFHPGKPLLNVVVIAIFFLLAKNPRPTLTASDKESNPRLGGPMIKYLLGLLLIGLLLDETGIFCFFLLPVWRPDYFLPRHARTADIKTCLRNGFVYSAPIIIFLVIITVVAPAITLHAFGEKLELLKYLGQRMDPRKLSPAFLAWRTVTIFSASLIPWEMIRLQVPVTGNIYVKNYGLIVASYMLLFLAATFMVYRGKKYRLVYGKILSVLTIFLLFQTILLGFHHQTLTLTGYYYGAIFSVLFAVFVSVILAVWCTRRKSGVWFARLIVCYIVAVQFLNFNTMNSMRLRHSDWKGTSYFRVSGFKSVSAAEASLIKQQLVLESLKFAYGRYYLPNAFPVDSKRKFMMVKEIWKDWKKDRCAPFSIPRDRMFLENLWAIGELCPEQYPDLFSRPANMKKEGS